MLVTCQSCGRQISDKAVTCPKCNAAGDAAFGTTVQCKECGAPFRPSCGSCENCGAPSHVALGKIDLNELETAPTIPSGVVTSRQKQLEPQRLDQKPGFARGGFGKAMSYVLLLVGLLTSIGVVVGWFTSRTGIEHPGYYVGQAIIVFGIVGGAYRATSARQSRTALDWFCGIVLIFVTGVWMITAMNVLDSMRYVQTEPAFYIYIGIVTLFVFSGTVVSIRLLRAPYIEKKPSFTAGGL